MIKNINNFFVVLFSTFKNTECIEISKKSKKLPFIFLIISLIILSLPIIVIIQSQNGSDWLTKNSQYIYDIDTGLTKFSEYNKTKDKKIKFLIKQENNKHFIDINQQEWNEMFKTFSNSIKNVNCFVWKRTYNDKEKIFLKIFFIDTNDKQKFNDFINEILNDKDEKNKSSFIVFGKYDICCYLFSLKEQKFVSYLIGNYNKITVGTNLLKDFYVANNSEETLKKWLLFFDNAFDGIRNEYTKITILNFLIIYMFYIFLLSLMIWIFNKNKKLYSFVQYQKIFYCFTFVPAIITLLISLLFSTYNINIFLFLFSIRIMWFNTNTLNIPTTENKN